MLVSLTLVALSTAVLYVLNAWPAMGAMSLLVAPFVGSLAYLVAALIHYATMSQAERDRIDADPADLPLTEARD